MNIEQTFIALRATAFLSSLHFAAYYWLGTRRPWAGFVLWHSIHLGFILWLGFGLHYPFGAFTIVTGGFGYVVLGALAAGEWLRPGTLVRFSTGVHFLWLSLIGTYLMQIARAYAQGALGGRIHSFVAAAILLAAAAVRLRKYREDRPAGGRNRPGRASPKNNSGSAIIRPGDLAP